MTIEPIAPARRVEVYCRAIELSARETAVLGRIVGGADTRRAARELGITEHTVNDHLRSVFTKSGTHSRAELSAPLTADVLSVFSALAETRSQIGRSVRIGT